MAQKPSKNKATAPKRNKGGGGGSSPKRRGGRKTPGRKTPTTHSATEAARSDNRISRRGAAVRQGRPLTDAESRQREADRRKEREEEIKAQAKARAERDPKGVVSHRRRGSDRED